MIDTVKWPSWTGAFQCTADQIKHWIELKENKNLYVVRGKAHCSQNSGKRRICGLGLEAKWAHYTAKKGALDLFTFSFSTPLRATCWSPMMFDTTAREINEGEQMNDDSTPMRGKIIQHVSFQLWMQTVFQWVKQKYYILNDSLNVAQIQDR